MIENNAGLLAAATRCLRASIITQQNGVQPPTGLWISLWVIVWQHGRRLAWVTRYFFQVFQLNLKIVSKQRIEK
ncbi:hypothetical protein [Serpentinimonas raichei]|uniref:hypothetical protein n=1 Tax=Serpentinimonas raichei TaxID=1458425 RepID=UPI001184F661|nr:hypothetical protein [Serpentinimonas raichei]